MSFVPVTGPAEFRADPIPRESVVTFSDARRTVALPIKAALPVLSKSRSQTDRHPSVTLLSGAVLLALRLVAAGRLAPAADRQSWRVSGLSAADEGAVRRLAASAADLDPAKAEGIVRGMLDAVADSMPRSAPPPAVVPDAKHPAGRHSGAQRLGLAKPSWEERLAKRIKHERPDLPQLVRLTLRVEADEEELLTGAIRVVLQVHDERDPLHFCDAAVLFLEGPDSHGFGDRARTHASLALTQAADAWPVLDRLLGLRVPDEITLDAIEIASLLDEGITSLRAKGIDVLWPRSLGRDLTARVSLDRTSSAPAGHREEPLQDPLLGTTSLFAFNWQLALHGDPLTAEEMEQLANAASPILKLRGNWTVVDPALAKKARKRLVRTVGPAQAVAAALTGALQVGTQDEPIDAEVIVGASLLKVRDQLLNAASREPIPVPAALQATLRDYQRHGLTWLADLTQLGLGACLADDMGLGKTITLIALHLHRIDSSGDLDPSTGSGQAKLDQPGGLPTLVVCPASLLGNWEAEIKRFAPGVGVRRFHGASRNLDDLTGGFVLTTYGTMRVDHEALAQVPWDLVVADEAQHIKNPQASTAKALRKIPSAARVALTGTPVENNLTELWAILDWATPGLLGSRNAFRKVWAAPIESGVDPAKAKQFANLIEPFLLRRRKSDPGIAPELPPKTETDHPISLTREQVVLYEAFVRDSMERIERSDPDGRRGLVLALLTGLKQICNHPAHFLKQSGAVKLRGRSEKLDLLDELVGTVLAEDGATLIFTQYVAMARLIETYLDPLGVPQQFLHGGTPIPERERMVKRFQDGEKPVFLLSLKAGGTGLNLTRADHVIHFDRWWNPAVEEQATDRAYRIGQTKPVQVHRMITSGTVEEKIAELLTRKRSLADAVLGVGEGALTELSNDELRDLVTLRNP